MPGGIYLIGKDDQLVEMKEQPYQSEALLQGWLAKYSDLLAGDQIDGATPRRWVLVSREVPVPSEEDAGGRWSLDHLFLDQDGVPTFVEVKRSTDGRIRREVVGQMLDYAANATAYWPIESLRQRFEKTCQTNGQDSLVVLEKLLGQPADIESFWNQVKDNLKSRRIRLLFVADEIPLELRRIIEFLNEEMENTEVLAVEVRKYEGGAGLKALVPRVFGLTMQAEDRKGKRRWDEPSFFRELEQRTGPEEAAVARKIYDWARSRADVYIDWGSGQRNGSFIPVLRTREREHYLFALYTYGRLETYFQHYQSRPPFDTEEKRRQLLAKINSPLPESGKIPDDAITRRPSISLAVLRDADVLRSLLETFEWFIDEAKGSVR